MPYGVTHFQWQGYPVSWEIHHRLKSVTVHQFDLFNLILKFNDYENCLFKNEMILKSQQRFKSEAHCLYTEEINQIALSSNDDKTLQTFDRITIYPYGTNT